MASGVEAGVVLVFVFNPVWVVKTRLALQGVDLKQKRKYTGVIGMSCIDSRLTLIVVSDAFSSIAKEEGIRGLYKGIVPALFLTSHGAIQVFSTAFYSYWCHDDLSLCSLLFMNI